MSDMDPQDFDERLVRQAIELARSFEGEAPRATALIAVARALLAEKAK